jgi:hypothetical protein
MFAEGPARIPGPRHIVEPGLAQVNIGYADYIEGVWWQLAHWLPAQDNLGIGLEILPIWRG